VGENPVEKISWKILGGKFGEKKPQYFSTKSSKYRNPLENDLVSFLEIFLNYWKQHGKIQNSPQNLAILPICL
jgi:hypothetical protein